MQSVYHSHPLADPGLFYSSLSIGQGTDFGGMVFQLSAMLLLQSCYFHCEVQLACPSPFFFLWGSHLRDESAETRRLVLSDAVSAASPLWPTAGPLWENWSRSLSGRPRSSVTSAAVALVKQWFPSAITQLDTASFVMSREWYSFGIILLWLLCDVRKLPNE